jgi:hypothetical protein
VPANQVMGVAKYESATPYDVNGVEFGHPGRECLLDALVKQHGLACEPAIVLLANIVNGADTDKLASESAGVRRAECDCRRLPATGVGGRP